MGLAMAINQMGKGWSHKKTIKAMLSPSLLDIAWASGIYEGEGSCVFNETAQVSVSQADPWLIKKFASLFGGRVSKHSPTGLGKKTIYKWSVSGPRARGFLLTVYSFLSIRRRLQARKALGCQFKKGGPKSVLYKGERKRLFEWARARNLSPTTLSTRLSRGWTFEQAIEIPLGASRVWDWRVV